MKRGSPCNFSFCHGWSVLFSLSFARFSQACKADFSELEPDIGALRLTETDILLTDLFWRHFDAL